LMRMNALVSSLRAQRFVDALFLYLIVPW